MSDNPQPDFDTGIMVNPEDSTLWANEKGELYTYPLCRGVRIALNQSSFVRGAEPGRIIVRMLCGPEPAEGIELAGMAFTVSPAGARDIAADLIAYANAVQRQSPIEALDAEHDAAVRTVRHTAASLEQPRP